MAIPLSIWVFVDITNDLTLSQESFYVAASRAKYNLQLYVSNQAKLVEKAQAPRAQLKGIELIREQKQKEVVSTTHSTPEQQPNKTSQPNHERNQSDQSNLQRNSLRSSKPNPPTARKSRIEFQQTSRKFRVEPPKLKTRARGLSDGINSFTDQKEIERLKGSFRELNRHLENRIFSTRRTEALRNAIERLNGTITEYARRQHQQKLEAINNHVEESTLESDIELIDAIKKLHQVLKSQSPSAINNLQNLQDAINKYAQLLLQSQSSLEQAKQVFRQEYERLRSQVHSEPNLYNAGIEKVDLAVAMLVIKESIESGQQDNLRERVERVLSQSDRLKEWKQSMPEGEYKAQAKEYIIQKFERASQIRESILSARKNQEIEFER